MGKSVSQAVSLPRWRWRVNKPSRLNDCLSIFTNMTGIIKQSATTATIRSACVWCGVLPTKVNMPSAAAGATVAVA